MLFLYEDAGRVKCSGSRGPGLTLAVRSSYLPLLVLRGVPWSLELLRHPLSLSLLAQIQLYVPTIFCSSPPLYF